MKKFIHDFKLIRNERLSAEYFILYLECPSPLPEMLPGQFAEVLVEGSPSTYLRRPFSIYEVDRSSGALSILIKKVGKGTQALYDLNAGATVNMVYPLGNSFSFPDGNRALLVGGGVGIAPMYYLAQNLHDNRIEVDVLIGGRTSADIIEPFKYKPFGNVYITTEDGTMGEKGLVTEHSLFSTERYNYSKVYACGPDPMMRAVARLAYSKGTACEVSLEHLMACGIGACLCCIVETKEGNKTTCVDGPVFDSRDLAGWHS